MSTTHQPYFGQLLYFIQENNGPGMRIYTFLQSWWFSIFPLLHIWEINKSSSPKETFEAQARVLRAKAVEPWEHLVVCSSSRASCPLAGEIRAWLQPLLQSWRNTVWKHRHLEYWNLLQSMEKKDKRWAVIQACKRSYLLNLMEGKGL